MKKYPLIALLPYYLLTAIVCIGLAGWGSRNVSAFVQNSPVSREHTVVIDPGHGGIDGGATSCTGVLESSINLQLSLRLRDLLSLLGYDTKMTRTTDTSIHTEGNSIAAQKVSDLQQRAKLTDETPNAVLISIHQNIFPDSRYSGAQIFYGAGEHSREFACAMQEAFCRSVNPGSRRKIKSAESIWLLQNVKCPAVLVECGFLSNPQEEEKLRSEQYQKQLCCAIAAGLGDFLKSNG